MIHAATPRFVKKELIHTEVMEVILKKLVRHKLAVVSAPIRSSSLQVRAQSKTVVIDSGVQHHWAHRDHL